MKEYRIINPNMSNKISETVGSIKFKQDNGFSIIDIKIHRGHKKEMIEKMELLLQDLIIAFNNNNLKVIAKKKGNKNEK